MNGALVIKKGGNATVPGDAPIQPPQAWVDCMIVLNGMSVATSFDFSNKNIATITDYSFLQPYGAFDQGGGPYDFLFNGNKMNTASVDACLAFFADPSNSLFLPATLNLSNQTPPAPPTHDAPASARASFNVASSFTASGPGDFFTFPGLGAATPAGFWFNVDGGNTAPTPTDPTTSPFIEVDIGALDDGNAIANAVLSALSTAGINWSGVVSSINITITAGAVDTMVGNPENTGPGFVSYNYTPPHNAAQAALQTAGWTVTTD